MKGNNLMKMTFKFEGIDCAVCALKLEEKIKKQEYVNDCSINFLASRMDLDIKDKDDLEKIVKICSDFEDGVTIKRIK